MNRPFRNTYGGAALLAQGINEGVQSFAKNFVDMQQQNTYQRLADLNGRRQALNEGLLTGEQAPLPEVSSGTQTPPPAPHGQPSIGADALATLPAPRRPMGELAEDELRQAVFSHTVQSRQNDLDNENDLDMLKRAFHYNSLMSSTKPYLDTWARVLDEARGNPDKSQWRGVMTLTGDDDPDRAFGTASQEYLKLREQYGRYSQAYTPLGDQLKGRGITADMYGDEAKLIELLNRLKAQPHRPRMGTLPIAPGQAGIYRGRSFSGRSR